MKIIFIIFIVAMLILTAAFSLAAKRKIRCFLLYLLSGVGLFVIMCILGNFYEPVKLNLNWFNLTVSASCGVPGVLFLLALKFLL